MTDVPVPTIAAADHRPPHHRPPRRRPVSRSTSLLVLLLLAVPLLAGCLRGQMSLGISSDDRVSGELVLAVPATDGATGPTVAVPDALADRVSVEEYSAQDDAGTFIGSRIFFDDLSFAEVGLLGGLVEQGSDAYRLELRRAGDIVALEGEVDLSAAPGADVALRVNFPARVATTNGERVLGSDSEVRWTLPAGSSTLVQATARYADPSVRSFTGWTFLLGGVVGAVAVLVAVLALLARDRSPRPGRVRR